MQQRINKKLKEIKLTFQSRDEIDESLLGVRRKR